MVERAVVLCQSLEIGPQHLMIGVVTDSVEKAASAPAPTAQPSGGQRARSLGEEIDALERERILAALEKTGGNQTRAATLLGIARRTLIARMEAYGVPRPRKG
jgi:DNA-binding NtrC family response regulator